MLLKAAYRYESYFSLAHPNERPRRSPVIMRQMPDEIAHDRSNDQTRQQLRRSNAMKGYARVGRRRGLRAAIERIEHRDAVSSARRPGSERGIVFKECRETKGLPLRTEEVWTSENITTLEIASPYDRSRNKKVARLILSSSALTSSSHCLGKAEKPKMAATELLQDLA